MGGGGGGGVTVIEGVLEALSRGYFTTTDYFEPVG